MWNARRPWPRWVSWRDSEKYGTIQEYAGHCLSANTRAELNALSLFFRMSHVTFPQMGESFFSRPGKSVKRDHVITHNRAAEGNMTRGIKILFILCAFLALANASFDFACGHMSENLSSPHECPLCTTFQSTDFSQHSLASLLSFFVRTNQRIVPEDQSFHFPDVVSSGFLLRAPPSSVA